MSSREGMSLRDILRAIRAIINGESVPADFEQKRDQASKSIWPNFVSKMLSVRMLFLIVAIFLSIRAMEWVLRWIDPTP